MTFPDARQAMVLGMLGAMSMSCVFSLFGFAWATWGWLCCLAVTGWAVGVEAVDTYDRRKARRGRKDHDG